MMKHPGASSIKRDSVVSARRCSFAADTATIGSNLSESRNVMIAAGDIDTFRHVMDWYNENLRRPGDVVNVFKSIPQPFVNRRSKPSCPVVPGSVTSFSALPKLNRTVTEGVRYFESACAELCRSMAIPNNFYAVSTRKKPVHKLAEYLRNYEGMVDLVIIGSGRPKKHSSLLCSRLRKPHRARYCLMKHCSIPVVVLPHPSTLSGWRSTSNQSRL